MRWFARVAACFLFMVHGVIYPDVLNASESIYVFVGRQVEFAKATDPCQEPGNSDQSEAMEMREACIQFDALFDAKYEVVKALVGSSDSGVLEFEVADHYGFPEFAKYEHALLFVVRDRGDMFLAKYQGYAVHETLDGSWAACGNPYDDRAGESPRRLSDIQFREVFGNTEVLSRAGINQIYDSRY